MTSEPRPAVLDSDVIFNHIPSSHSTLFVYTTTDEQQKAA